MSLLSLGNLHGSIAVKGSALRRFSAFLGPGYLVATGYMDPGNWATAIAGGSQTGMVLLCVVVLSSLLAILLQALSARLAIATGHDLAQVCRASLPTPLVVVLWVVAEAGILATDLAEVIGTAIGLTLLFGLPLWLGVLITALDVFLILAFERLGFRKIEAFVVALLVVISVCFAWQLVLARPDMGAILRGLVPTATLINDPATLYLGLGILGATIMPHNLFLHSGIVLTRAVGPLLEQKREAIRFATLDSGIALTFALTINGSLLILAASTFHQNGHHDITELKDAWQLIAPLLGAPIASTLFAIALIACGLNSTLTATLAGQIVMEGFVHLRLSPALRRLVTRLIAIVPAIAVTLVSGEGATGRMLVFSQVVLSFALPFAIVPLVAFTASRKRMGELAAPRATSIAAALVAAGIILLNCKLIWDVLAG